MDGPNNYLDSDDSDSSDASNTSAGRSSIIGTLIHTTSGTSSLAWLTTGAARTGKPASADFLIDRDGHRHKLVKPGYYPYHAGRSRYNIYGREYSGDGLSSILLGVELENLDSQLCTWQQLDSLAELLVLVGLDNGWRWPYYLVGHYEVALPLGRRLDPLGFDWGDFMGRLYARALYAKVEGL